MTSKHSVPADPRAASPGVAGLRVSSPGDRWEREADRTADQVMRMQAEPALLGGPSGIPAPRALTSTRGWSGIQRCPGGCPGEDDSDTVMRAADGAAASPGTVATPAPTAALPGPPGRLVSTRGRLLSHELRTFFEPRFGHDFARVRVHDSPEAGAAAASVAARAFTLGRDVVFAAGALLPHSTGGRRLLAHELAHVVQQGAAQRLEAPS